MEFKKYLEINQYLEFAVVLCTVVGECWRKHKRMGRHTDYGENGRN